MKFNYQNIHSEVGGLVGHCRKTVKPISMGNPSFLFSFISGTM